MLPSRLKTTDIHFNFFTNIFTAFQLLANAFSVPKCCLSAVVVMQNRNLEEETWGWVCKLYPEVREKPIAGHLLS